jgi:hypothetical protein
VRVPGPVPAVPSGRGRGLPVSGCAVIVLLPLAMAVTGVSVALGGLSWAAAASCWLLWLLAVRASVRHYRRAQAKALRPAPLPWRLPATPAEVAALNGRADLQAVVDSTPLRHMEAL